MGFLVVVWARVRERGWAVVVGGWCAQKLSVVPRTRARLPDCCLVVAQANRPNMLSIISLLPRPPTLLDRRAVLTGGTAAVLATAVARPSFAEEPAAAAPACDEACRRMLAERRALFQQSRTTSDRQVILDLSRQRAKLYNTTFRGASCIPGIPCI